MLVFIANNAATDGTTTSLALRALRELVLRRDDRITELEAEIKRTKDRGNVYISKDMLNVTASDGTVHASIGAIGDSRAVDITAYPYYQKWTLADAELVKAGWSYVNGQWVAPEADPVVSVPVAKEPVTDEKGFSLSLDKEFIRIATDKTLDTINKHLAGADWSALGNTSAAKAEDTLRYSHNGLFAHGEVGQLFINKNIIGNEGYLYAELARADDTLRDAVAALQAQVNQHRDAGNGNLAVDERRHHEQQAWNKHQNQRINDIEDALRAAFSDKGKGKNEQTKNLEDAMRRAACEMLQNALKPGGILHRY